MEAEFGTAKQAALAYVVAASLAMCGLHLSRRGESHTSTFAVSQGLAPDALATPAARMRAVLGAAVRGPGLRLVVVAGVVALGIAGAATLWTGTRWLTAPAPNYGHQNPESLAYWLATYTPLGWGGALALVRALGAATVLGALAFVPLRRFDDAVRVAAVVVIAASLALPFHSPHWNLWFYLLLCLLPISRPLFLLLVAYDLVNLLFWPLFSYATPIEATRPVAEVVWPYLVLVVWLLRDTRRPDPEPCSGAAAGLYSGA